MDSKVSNTEQHVEVHTDGDNSKVNQLDKLQLALVGGGCAEVCPY